MSNYIEGTDGNDWLVANGDDTVEAGAGFDTISFAASPTAVVSHSSILKSAEQVILSALSDDVSLFRANAWGGAGNDRIQAYSGILYGEAGDDWLMLEQGRMYGGDGNDKLLLDQGVVRGGNGHDVIRSGFTASVAYGDAGNDTIQAGKAYGGAGNDTVVGLKYADGGNGNDTISLGIGGGMRGGAGKDAFLMGDGMPERIVDFRPVDDSFRFDDRFWSGIGHGTKAHPTKLAADAFHVGSKAADAEDRFVYNKDTGKLFYDYDGSGEGHASLVAQLSKGLKLAYHDFYVI